MPAVSGADIDLSWEGSSEMSPELLPSLWRVLVSPETPGSFSLDFRAVGRHWLQWALAGASGIVFVASVGLASGILKFCLEKRVTDRIVTRSPGA